MSVLGLELFLEKVAVVLLTSLIVFRSLSLIAVETDSSEDENNSDHDTSNCTSSETGVNLCPSFTFGNISFVNDFFCGFNSYGILRFGFL